MDGVIVDSEPFWQDVEIEVLDGLGVPLTRDLCRHTMGFRVDEAVGYWFDRYPWDEPTVDDVVGRIMDGVVERVRRDGVLIDGVREAVDFCVGAGLRLAVASSSFYRIIDAVLDRFDLRRAFSVVHSAEDEPRGKPDPGVYLTAAAKLGVAPAACVAIEDSVNGVLSARAAGMRCVAVPDGGVAGDERFAAADVVLASLRDFNGDVWAWLASA